MRRLRHCPYQEISAAHSMLDGGLFDVADGGDLTGLAAEAYNAGVHAYDCTDVEGAIQHFTKAASLAPDEWPVRNNLGIALAQRGHAEEGLEQLRVAARLSGDDPVVLRNIGALHWSRDENGEALEALSRATASPDTASTTWYMLARIHESVGEDEKAIDAMRHAVALEPEECAAHDNLGVMLQKAGRLEEAVAVYREATAADPAHPLPWYNLATALAALERWNEAEEAYRRHMALDDEHSCPHWELGRVLSKLGRGEEALAEFLIYQELEPDDPRGTTSVAVEQMLAGNVDDAEASIDRAFALGEPDAWMWNVRSGIAERRGDGASALDAARTAASLAPDDPGFAWRVVELLADSEAVDEAIAEAAKREPPQRDWLLKELVEHLSERERFPEALKTARALNEFRPDEIWAVGFLGESLADNERWREAAEQFERIVARDPGEDMAKLRAAECWARCGNAERALALLNVVVAQQPDNIPLLELRLWCLLALERESEANADAGPAPSP